MNATTISAAGARTAPVLDRVAEVLLLVFAATLLIQISVAQIVLSAMLLCWVALLVRDRVRPAAPAFFLPLAAYAALTLVSALFSLDAAESVADSKQLVLFLIVPAVYHIAGRRHTGETERGMRASTVIDVIVTVGAAGAAVGIIQYGMLQYDNLGQRPQGTLTHYMTYSGVLMLVICAAVARLAFGSRERTWPALIMPALVVALSLTLGRAAWVGTSVAVGLLLVLKDLRLTALLPVVIALVFALAPDSVTERMMSVFDQRDPTRVDRLDMMRIGAGIVADHPLTGVGPNMVPRVYADYQAPGTDGRVNPHLHNVPLQIAAERGLPALGVWLWFVAAAAAGLFRHFRASRERVLPGAALAALTAMLAAGMFEYNFGDSEFLMLLLVLITLPFAAARRDARDLDAAPSYRA
jgi:O-antigen ligase